MKLACLVVLAACDQAFGLTTTHLIDGRPIDAPFGCPPIGQTPRFAVGVHQVAVGSCQYYMVAGPRAVAICYPSGHISEGPAGGPLEEVAALSAVAAIEAPRLVPEATDILIHTVVTPKPNQRVDQLHVYHRDSDTSWSYAYDPAIPMVAGDSLGTLTSGAVGRRLMIASMATGFSEYISDGGTGWAPGPVHSPSELGATGLGVPTMTSDGLRMVFSGIRDGMTTRAILYTDRPTTGAVFRKADVLDGVPPLVYDPFLADDCARVYFSAGDVGAVFFSQQL